MPSGKVNTRGYLNLNAEPPVKKIQGLEHCAEHIIAPATAGLLIHPEQYVSTYHRQDPRRIATGSTDISVPHWPK